jgi:hypothetical protein
MKANWLIRGLSFTFFVLLARMFFFYLFVLGNCKSTVIDRRLHISYIYSINIDPSFPESIQQLRYPRLFLYHIDNIRILLLYNTMTRLELLF